jgi:hypothetical protein
MRLHYFQHERFEGLGMIADWAKKHGHVLSCTPFFDESARLPQLADYDALVVVRGSQPRRRISARRSRPASTYSASVSARS